MAIYQIYGPDSEWLTQSDVLKRLGDISESTLRQMIREGRFPRPVRAGPQSPPRWAGVAMALWEGLQPMLQVDGEDEPPAKKGGG